MLVVFLVHSFVNSLLLLCACWAFLTFLSQKIQQKGQIGTIEVCLCLGKIFFFFFKVKVYDLAVEWILY